MIDKIYTFFNQKEKEAFTYVYPETLAIHRWSHTWFINSHQLFLEVYRNFYRQNEELSDQVTQLQSRIAQIEKQDRSEK